MKRCCFFRLLLILLFTLLQSVAPLAHAHVDGYQINDRPHAVELELNLVSVPDQPTLSAPDSPAIGMPLLLPRSLAQTDLAPPPIRMELPFRASFILGQTSPPLPLSPAQAPTCETPFAHAPPALA